MCVLALMLSACAGFGSSRQETASTQADESPAASSADSGDAETSAVDIPGLINGVRIDQESSPENVRTVYFEYDSSEVRSEFISIIAAHGELLSVDRGRRVVLEGHADERGSREYNIALGERRALSVRRLLLSSGGSSSQVQVISYGEERPAVVGQNEAAWSQNRRVKIRYE